MSLTSAADAVASAARELSAAEARRPVIRRSFRLAVIDERQVLAIGERDQYVLSGQAFVVLAELLKEPRSVAELVDAASTRASEIEVFYALERLETLGILREAGETLPPEAETFWDALRTRPDAAVRRTRAATIAVRGAGAVSAARVEETMKTAGVRVVDDGELLVVVTGDYLSADLAAINAARIREGSPWLLAKPVGTRLWIGPLFRPGATGCWECLAHRLRRNGVMESPNGSLASTEMLAASLLATEIAKWLAAAPGSALESSLVTFDLETLVTERHPFTRRPQCVACGEPNLPSRAPDEPRLVSRAKECTADGGHRAATPEATLARFGHHVSPLTGIVRELRSAATDPAVAPVIVSGPNPSSDDGDGARGARFRGSTAGKGTREPQARAGALCEALERYSGVFDGTEVRRRATLASLGDAAIHPNDCMLYSARQYARRNDVPRTRHRRVPAPFDEETEIEWSPLWSLTEERFKYLPTAYCYYNYPLPGPERFCWADSNGCAAGTSREEAVLQGFLELVERDCAALWWYNRLRRPAVDLSSFDDPYLDALQRYYRSMGREIRVLDITSDLGIPAFAAVSRRTADAAERILFGLGCHLDAGAALLRAVTEVNQSLPMVMGDSGVTPPRGDEDIASWLNTATVAAHPFLAPSGARPMRRGDYAVRHSEDLLDDVKTCVGIAARHGLETLVLDQTRPDVALPVVRVVVPGLRHFWSRLGSGRLYDVPVEQGWLDAPLAEDQLNPIPFFF